MGFLAQTANSVSAKGVGVSPPLCHYSTLS